MAANSQDTGGVVVVKSSDVKAATISSLDDALAHIVRHEDVWFATGEEIAAHYLAHHHDEVAALTGGGR